MHAGLERYALKASGKSPALIEGGLLDYSPSFVERAGNVTNGYVEASGLLARPTLDLEWVLCVSSRVRFPTLRAQPMVTR